MSNLNICFLIISLFSGVLAFSSEEQAEPSAKRQRLEGNFFSFLEEKNWSELRRLIEDGQVSISDINDRGSDSKFSPLGLLVRHSQESLISLMLEKDLISVEGLNTISSRHSVLGMLAFKKRWELISLMLEKDLISVEGLNTFLLDESSGISVLGMLAFKKRWELISLMLEKDLISVEGLNTPIKIKITGLQITGLEKHCGKSALWFLAESRQWRLCTLLQRKKLISKKGLDSSDLPYDQHRRSVLWLFADGNQRELLAALLSEGLISSEALSVKDDSLRSVLDCITAYDQKSDLIRELSKQGIIGYENLASEISIANIMCDNEDVDVKILIEVLTCAYKRGDNKVQIPIINMMIFDRLSNGDRSNLESRQISDVYTNQMLFPLLAIVEKQEEICINHGLCFQSLKEMNPRIAIRVSNFRTTVLVLRKSLAKLPSELICLILKFEYGLDMSSDTLQMIL